MGDRVSIYDPEPSFARYVVGIEAYLFEWSGYYIALRPERDESGVSRQIAPLARASAYAKGLFLNACDSLSLPARSKGLPLAPAGNRHDADARKRVQIVMIELTTRCPLRCPQCYCDLANGMDIDLDILRSLLTEAAEKGAELIGLSGGEPTMYPHILETIQFINATGMKSTMATSGWGLTGERLREYYDSGLSLLSISINGSTKEIHGLSRDGYEYALSAMETLRVSGLPYAVNWVARKDNVYDFPNVVELARKYGAQLVEILRLKPDSTGDISNCLEGDGFSFLVDYLDAYAHEGPLLYIEACYANLRASVRNANIRGNQYIGCQAGRSVIAVNARGQLKPSPHLQFPETRFTIGEYFNQSVTVRRLRGMDRRTGRPCSNCAKRVVCRPCRSMCLELYGDLSSGDLRCPSWTPVKRPLNPDPYPWSIFRP